MEKDGKSRQNDNPHAEHMDEASLKYSVHLCYWRITLQYSNEFKSLKSFIMQVSHPL